MHLLQVIGSVIGASLVLFILQSIYTAITSPLRSLPGPFISRFSSARLKYALITGQKIFYVENLHQRYGPVVRVSPDEVAISDLQGYKTIHNINSNFVRGPWYFEITNLPRHSILTMNNSKDHAARRRILARGYSKSHLRDNWEWVIRDRAKMAVSKIHDLATTGNVDVLKWFTFFSSDVISILGFGEAFGHLELGKETDYVRVLHKTMFGNGVGAEFPWIRSLLAKFPFKSIEETFNSSRTLLEYGKKAVINAESKAGKGNLMTTVLEEGRKEGSKLDDLDISVEATVMIFAGSGTVAITTTYMLWAILCHPQLQRDLEKELEALEEDFSDVDLEVLPLLNATISESVRLYTAVAGSLPRIVPKGGCVIAGHFIPEGFTVSTQAYSMHRKTEYWDNPFIFEPKRWLPGGSATPEARATMCGFGAGEYTCLGQHLAYMEMRCMIANIFRTCKGLKIAPSMTPEMMEFENYAFIQPKGNKLEVTLRA